VFVCTHILTVRTQVFLFKANYGTAVSLKLPFSTSYNVYYVNFREIKEQK